MPEALLGLDVGTTSVRALVIDTAGECLGRALRPCLPRFPAPGRVEHDPKSVWETALIVCREAIAASPFAPTEIVAMGISSQRACCIVWERATGNPLTPLVSWQDTRGVRRSQELMRLGFPVQPQQSAAKLEALLDAIPDGRARAAANELRWGNVDSFLLARLTDTCATDPSQACATGYYDYEADSWNADLLAAQRLPESFFPSIRDTASQFGECAIDHLGAPIPVAAMVGDQQSGAFAQGCTEVGDAKITFGTSATCDVCSGESMLMPTGTYPLVAWRLDGARIFCVEGMVFTAGAVFEWLAHGLGIAASAEQCVRLAESVSDSDGVWCLPALQGLGTPYFDPTQTAAIGGLTRGSQPQHLARAAMEGIAFRVREMWDAIYADALLSTPQAVRVDGGASASDTWMQLIADTLGLRVKRMDPVDASAYGAAVLAGRTAGVDVASSETRAGATFEPQWSESTRNERFESWRAHAFGI